MASGGVARRCAREEVPGLRRPPQTRKPLGGHGAGRPDGPRRERGAHSGRGDGPQRFSQSCQACGEQSPWRPCWVNRGCPGAHWLGLFPGGLEKGGGGGGDRAGRRGPAPGIEMFIAPWMEAKETGQRFPGPGSAAPMPPWGCMESSPCVCVDLVQPRTVTFKSTSVQFNSELTFPKERARVFPRGCR